MAGKNISAKKKISTVRSDLARGKERKKDYNIKKLTIGDAWALFMLDRKAKGLELASIKAYNRFYRKLKAYGEQKNVDVFGSEVKILSDESFRIVFVASLNTPNKVSQQTINHYLRSYRAFGNWLEEQGYIVGFKCPIKEVDPPIKELYTDKELNRLLKEPDIEDFVEYRSFTIISLILATGARSNTILNIHINDVDLENGYIAFNTTKAHKSVLLGLEPKSRLALSKYITRWRSFESTMPTDYLFCTMSEVQMSRQALVKSIAKYNNNRGVDKTSIHLLRHTFAHRWITSGGDLITLAKVLTHSELEMVKRYSNLYDNDVKDAIEQHSAISVISKEHKHTIKHKNIK